MQAEFRTTGSTVRMEHFLGSMQRLNVRQILEPYGQAGVAALESATPRDSGAAASSWRYEIKQSRGGVSITWHNDDIENGFPVAVMIQYGHGTGTGGYVQGRDYINPALRPIFDQIADAVWRVVTSA